MSDLSANLALPYLAASQAQKHVTHNEALQILDALVQLSVADRDRSAPPDAPQAGARHIVAPAATGDWAGQTGRIALWDGTGWIFCAPHPGWRAWIAAEQVEAIWRGGAWQALPLPVLDNLDGIGVNASFDATNRLTVASAATLLNHDGAGHRLKINKAAPGDTASLLFQSGFSGRAEMGLAGDDGWSVKVSADGAAWTEALALDPLSGHATGAAVQSDPLNAADGQLLTVGSLVLGGQTAGYEAPGNDLNNAVRFGAVDITITTLNAPPYNNGACFVLPRSNGRVAQLAVQLQGQSEPSLSMRNSFGGTSWSPWRPVIPESGSNANGKYVKFANGTMICTRSLASSASGNVTWTYPAAFVSVDSRSIAPASGAPRFVGFPSSSLTSSAFGAWDNSGARIAVLAELTAIGTWF